jgi:hypothetical protein
VISFVFFEKEILVPAELEREQESTGREHVIGCNQPGGGGGGGGHHPLLLFLFFSTQPINKSVAQA